MRMQRLDAQFLWIRRLRMCDRKSWHGRNMRVMPVDNYLVFYVPTHDDLTVTVMRIMYGGRDIDGQL